MNEQIAPELSNLWFSFFSAFFLNIPDHILVFDRHRRMNKIVYLQSKKLRYYYEYNLDIERVHRGNFPEFGP